MTTFRQHSTSYHQAGQSIIEVLIATLVVGLVLTAIASSLTFSIKNTAQTKQRELASNYAQEGLEVFRRERNLQGWTSFTEALNTNTFCLNELPADSQAFRDLPAGECEGGTVIAGSTLTRTAYVRVIDADTIEITIGVAWDDSNQMREVSVVQEFRNLGGK